MTDEMDRLAKLADIPGDRWSNEYPNSQAIKIGHSIVCDGYLPAKKENGQSDSSTTAVFSHFHQDHIYNIKRTFTGCDNIILSQTTYDALLGMGKITERGTFHVLEKPGDHFDTNYGESIELFDANHIPGSRQVLVTMKETDDRILYSGDFSYPGMTVPEADLLILESEHGENIYDFDTDKPSVLRSIWRKVYREIESGHPVEIRAQRGTMQDVMAELEKERFDDEDRNLINDVSDNSILKKHIPRKIPFLADEIDVNLTNSIKHRYNEDIREIEIAKNDRLDELHNKKEPYVRFAKVGRTTPQQDRATIIQVDVNKGFKTHGAFFSSGGRYFACLAAHSSYTNVLEYVKATKAKLVMIDGTRASMQTAKELANGISEKLLIPSYPKFCNHE